MYSSRIMVLSPNNNASSSFSQFHPLQLDLPYGPFLLGLLSLLLTPLQCVSSSLTLQISVHTSYSQERHFGAPAYRTCHPARLNLLQKS